MIKTKIHILLRNKFFFLLGIIILFSIFLITFTNLQTHENDLIQQIEKLEQKKTALNKQAEVAKDELSVERQLYEKTKKELNQKLKDEKEIHQKELHEIQMRFNSLQQQLKILSTKHEDLEQQCTDAKRQISTENDELRGKLSHVQAQFNKTVTSKDNDIAMWKGKHEIEASEKDKLQKLINDGVGPEKEDHQQYLHLKYKNYQLQQEIKDLKQKLHITSSGQNEQQQQQKTLNNSRVDKSFQEQIPVSDDHYKIPINILPQPKVQDQNQNVLQQPVLNPKTSTTTTPSPFKKIKKTTKSQKKLPKFVLPIPDLKNDEIVGEHSKESLKDDGKNVDESLNKPPNDEKYEVNENENGAHEINDNDFNIEEKNSHNHFDSNILNNAAEEFDGHKKPLVHDEMDLEIINRPPNGGNVKDKLKDEIANDHGKEEYPEEDLHIEQQEDDLGDIGEYDDPKNQGIAERN